MLEVRTVTPPPDGCAVGPVFDDDSEADKLLPQPVGFNKVLVGSRLVAFGNKVLDLIIGNGQVRALDVQFGRVEDLSDPGPGQNQGRLRDVRVVGW